MSCEKNILFETQIFYHKFHDKNIRCYQSNSLHFTKTNGFCAQYYVPIHRVFQIIIFVSFFKNVYESFSNKHG